MLLIFFEIFEIMIFLLLKMFIGISVVVDSVCIGISLVSVLLSESVVVCVMLLSVMMKLIVLIWLFVLRLCGEIKGVGKLFVVSMG